MTDSKLVYYLKWAPILIGCFVVGWLIGRLIVGFTSPLKDEKVLIPIALGIAMMVVIPLFMYGVVRFFFGV